MRKRRFKKLNALVLAAALLLGSAVPAAADEAGTGTYAGEEQTTAVSVGMTQRENNFNDGWKFYLGNNSSASGTNFDDSSWEDVTLPHDFSISQSFTTSGEAESGFLPGGTGWYRKSFTLSESDAKKSIVLNFDGVYSDAYVYVNGSYVGEHHYGYSSFAFDITERLVCDGTTENVIAVRAVNNIPSSRWYSGSGIYRDVQLIITDPVHAAYDGIYVTTPDIASGVGTVNVQADIDNDTEEAVQVTVKNTVYTAGGEAASDTVETQATVEAGASSTVTASPVVSSPALWSIDSPNLYTVRTEVYVDDVLTDSCETEFGFRWYSFESGSGFYLNGEAVKLNGVCMHHDQGAAGSAAYYDAMYRQLASMKEMGVNAIRTSHNPADEDFIDICNELGLLVIEELFDGWLDPKNGNSYDFSAYFDDSISADNGLIYADSSMTWAEYVTKSVVRRDRNDPSVILWSLGNEIQEGTNWANIGSFASVAQNLIDWIKEEDTTRPATSGDNNRGGNSNLVAVLNTILSNGGVVGFNYTNSASALSSLASQYGGVIIASETSSATNSRGIYSSQANNSNADREYHLTSYDTSAVSWGIPAHDSIYNTMVNDSVAGEFVWTGWDYIGEPTPWNGVGRGSVSGNGAYPNSSYFGIVDTAGFEKDTYYLYRSQWNQDSTTLHLVTAWDSDNMYTTSGKTPVVIYSNAPKVELYRNGTLIGTAVRTVNTTTAGHEYYTYTTQSENSSICTAVQDSGADSLYATFNVAYEAGTINAVAYDENGAVISETSGSSSVSTPGTPSQLQISQSKTTVDADGQSLVYIEVEVLDAEGNLDTTAENTINFTLGGNGEIVGVDNGDQATTQKYQQSSVLTGTDSANIAAYAGKAVVIVRSTDTAGEINVQITSDGLTGGSVAVATQAVDEGDALEGLVSYTMVRDYSILAGTVPTLQTSAVGNLADGSTLTGSVVWDEITADIYNTPGDYTVSGTLSFTGFEDIAVTARLHVIANVIAMRNISTATAAGSQPSLPSTVRGVLADGTLSGEFGVTWDMPSADAFAAAGDIITVNGTVPVIGDIVLPVTCTVRVAEAVNTESTNAAVKATVSQNIDSAYQSDNLNAVNDGDTTYQDDVNTRWTNYNNRTNSDSAELTFTWATAEVLSGTNLYYYIDGFSAALPASVEFQYSLNGSDFTAVSYTSETIETNTYGQTVAYTFDQVINPVAVRVILTQQGGTTGGHCVGLIEAELMTYAGTITYNNSADLSAIYVDGAEIPGFSAETLTYSAEGTTVTASTGVNAGITVLPADGDGAVRILTISEDGSAEKVYQIAMSVKPSEPPTVSLSLSQNNGKIRMTGVMTNVDQTTSHGFIYITKARLGNKTLTVNTSGRTKLTINGYNADGSYAYSMTPKTANTRYAVRAFVTYVNDAGKTVYVYSNPIFVTYSEMT